MQVETTVPAKAVQSTRSYNLGPPFDSWVPIHCRSNPGFWCHDRLDPRRTSPHDNLWNIVLQQGAQPPSSNLRIGWTWAGYEKRIYARRGDLFIAAIRTGAVTVLPRGGQCVPRAFLTLRGHGNPVENSVVLSSNRAFGVQAIAPYSGYFTVGITFNIRSVFQGSANPYCEIIGDVSHLSQVRLHGPVAALEEGDAEDTEALSFIPEAATFDGDLDPEELASQLAQLGDEAGEAVSVRSLASDP